MIPLARPNVNTVEYWDRRYRDEVEVMWRIWTTGDLIAKIARHIPKNAYVLDAGCGAGIVPARIAEIRPDIRWSACDFSPESVAYLRRLSAVKFQKVFVANLELPIRIPSGSYDVVLCTEVLEHLSRPSLAVEEIVRIARQKVIVSVPHGSCIDSHEHIWRYTRSGIAKLLANHGTVSIETARNDRNLIGVLCK